jgi:tetratricopeptide (TPR) repeat protein
VNIATYRTLPAQTHFHQSPLPDSQRSPVSRHRRWIMIACPIVVLVAGAVFADYWSAKPLGLQASFVGRAACIDCHQKETHAFAGSHHDLAMDLATEATVLADFNDATIEHDGMVSRMFRDGDRFMVHTEGETGQMEDFEVKYVFGFDPLQQFMVEFDRRDDMPAEEVSRLQVLRISWDTKKKEWFYLRPPDVKEKLEPDDPLHWTGIAQRWQTMCAECHSTHLERNFDPKTQQYRTTFSEIDVSCEACHGPGSLHVELAGSKSLFWDRNYKYGLAQLKGDDPEPQLQTCAPCHSRRGMLDSHFHGGDIYTDHYSLELLQPDTYYDDGQIKDEVYVYGSFIQSRMHHKGVRCTDCHDPHSLKLKGNGNETCTSCHQHAAGKYDVPSHHHHEPGTPGAMCVSCHMPETTYMDVDPRRDHSLRIPRPDLSLKIGTPNACSGCHVADQAESLAPSTLASLGEYADWLLAAGEGEESVAAAIKKTDQWCEDACQQWYGEKRLTDPHFGETLNAFRSGEEGAVEQMLSLALKPDELAPPIARATALSELGNAGVAQAYPTARKILDNAEEHPIVRAAALNLFMSLPSVDPREGSNIVRKALMRHIDDPSRLVRTEAIRVLVTSGAYRSLSDSERSRVDLAIDELRDALMVASDRAGAHMGWAMLCESRGLAGEANQAYETAMKVEPLTTGPRTNLAALLEREAGNFSPAKAQQMMMRATQLRAEELPLLARDASLAPSNADLQYRYGLALYLSGDMEAAMTQLQLAVDLAPEVEIFRTARDLLKEKLSQ